MSTPIRTHEALRSDGAISAYGTARSTVEGTPLAPAELRNIDAYWRASLYLCLGMLYLKANPLLQEPLTLEQIKPRLLGHWGSDAGQAFTYIHFNRLINKYDLNAIYISGPEHGDDAICQCVRPAIGHSRHGLQHIRPGFSRRLSRGGVFRSCSRHILRGRGSRPCRGLAGMRRAGRGCHCE
jgi:hypothetical protein